MTFQPVTCELLATVLAAMWSATGFWACAPSIRCGTRMRLEVPRG